MKTEEAATATNVLAQDDPKEQGPPCTVGIIWGPSRPEKRVIAHRMRREMTPSEARLWQQVRANRLCGLHFRRQQIIDGFIADFYCHAAALVVEVDGSVHAEEGRQGYDTARDALLRGRGLRVLRFTNEQVQSDLPGVLNAIHAAATEGRPA